MIFGSKSYQHKYQYLFLVTNVDYLPLNYS